jgi:hypothetical protein
MYTLKFKNNENPNSRLVIWIAAALILSILYSAVYAFGDGPRHSTYSLFEEQWDGFAHGQLSLLEKPSEELLKLENPYDPKTNEGLKKYDVSLFNGKYYVYYGPTSALFVGILKLIGHQAISDGQIVFFWCIGLAWSLAALFYFMTNENIGLLFHTGNFKKPYSSTWLNISGYLLVGFNPGVVACLSRPEFYEAQVISGILFFSVGMVLYLYALLMRFQEKQMLQVSFLLFASGISFAFSFMGRYTFAIPITIISIFGLYFFIKHSKVNSQSFFSKKNLLYMGIYLLPLTTALIAYFILNYFKTGNILESGSSYVLAGLPLPQFNMFDLKYLPTNFYIYWISPLSFKAEFPFIYYIKHTLPEWTGDTYHFSDVRMVGLSIYALFILPMLLYLLNLSKIKYKVSYFSRFSLIFFTLFLSTNIVIMCHFSSSTRYYSDFLLFLLLALFLFNLGVIDTFRIEKMKTLEQATKIILGTLCITYSIGSSLLIIDPRMYFFDNALPLMKLHIFNFSDRKAKPLSISYNNEPLNLEELYFNFRRPINLLRVVLDGRLVTCESQYNSQHLLMGYKGKNEVFKQSFSNVQQDNHPIKVFSFTPVLVDAIKIITNKPIPYTKGINANCSPFKQSSAVFYHS